MERYLTSKTGPDRVVRLLENAALVVLFGLLGVCVYFVAEVAMLAYERKALDVKLLLLLVPLLLLVLVMNPIAERMRARRHALLIVRALEAAGCCIPADEAEDRIGVRAAADRAQELVTKGYLKDVRVERGFLLLAEAEEQLPPQEEVKQLFRDVEV